MASPTAPPPPPAVPGQYGALMPPNRDALRRNIESEIAQMPAVTGSSGAIFDTEVDAQSDSWEADIGSEYQRQLEQLQTRLGELAPRNRQQSALLTTARNDHALAKEAHDRAYFNLTGHRPPADPVPALSLAEADPATGGLAGSPQPGGQAADDRDIRLAHPPAAGTALVAADTPAATGPVPNPNRVYARHGELDNVSFGDVMHYLVLGLAGVADFVAFYQVLALVLGAIPELLYAAVLAVTLIALLLMHKAGTTARDVSARQPDGKIWIVVACVAAWVALGMGAFFMRLTVHDDTGASTSLLNFGGVQFGQDDTSVTTKAIVFLVVFVTTGVLALIGAYLTWNPFRSAYRKARKRLRKEAAALGRAESEASVSLQEAERLRKRLESGEKASADQAREHRRALGCELKSHARVQIAKRLTDPDEIKFLLNQPIPGCGGRAGARSGGAA
ncbi:hypothetical protein Cs7R123_29850 [Catellatospora sp. TT07R-123]|uniref:hypothetical protein n=1 Tax=Catellatospora sp. TT07R-123 TaxID=2733863 RepID=UPI001B2DB897|nr:hypothetical protein [Catellatospora sp. TT07R-123]GHJ45643.1 hypothetical protein Cs7R123_29850 [Catellatospora sp. TT07R-123]